MKQYLKFVNFHPSKKNPNVRKYLKNTHIDFFKNQRIYLKL